MLGLGGCHSLLSLAQRWDRSSRFPVGEEEWEVLHGRKTKENGETQKINCADFVISPRVRPSKTKAWSPRAKASVFLQI